MEKINKKKILFIIVFIALGFAVSQIPISVIVGAKKQIFTPFEFLGPTAGMFLSPVSGAISVFFVKLFNVVINHQKFDLTTVIRLFPMMFAAVYFGLQGAKRLNKLILIIPLAAIALFILHPEGKKVWFFSLYWLIPIICYFKKDRLILNALGSTFIAHAIGSVAFLYAINLPASVWLSLIPVVFMERMLFAIGIWATYLCLNSALEKLATKTGIVPLRLLVNQKYVFSKNFFRFNA